MTEHLDNERISRNPLGGNSAADRAHLAVCALCRGHVEEFERTLHALRDAVHQWSEAEYGAGFAPRPRRIARPVLAAAGCLAVVLCAFLMRPAPVSRPVVADSADIQMTDVQLMDQVRDDLARPVPRGMEALLP